MDNEEANLNREINFKALILLMDVGYPTIIESIRKEPNSYGINIEYIDKIVILLNEFPEVYEILSQSDKILIDAKVEANSNLAAKAFYKTDSFEDHLKYLIDHNYNLDNTTAEYIEEVAREHGLDKQANLLLIKSFGASGSFYTADARFNFIRPLLEKLDSDELKILLANINGNGQIYSRNMARRTNREVKEQCDKVLGEAFDYSQYQYFVRSL